jgi:ribosomal protein S12 methylthiotransferase accessory factor YcaO
LSEPRFISDVVTGGVTPFRQVQIPKTRTSAERLDRVEVLHRQVGDLHLSTAGLRRRGLVDELEDRQQSVSAQSGVDLLSMVSEAGFAWRDVARLAHVSVPAVQKWRRGEGMAGGNRYQIAKVVALIEVLANHFVNDPVSWLEMPVKDGVALSRMDLLAENRFDLVLELVSDDDNPVSAAQVLDEHNPNWRTDLVDSVFETFTATDGIVSIRPRS